MDLTLRVGNFWKNHHLSRNKKIKKNLKKKTQNNTRLVCITLQLEQNNVNNWLYSDRNSAAEWLESPNYEFTTKRKKSLSKSLYSSCPSTVPSVLLSCPLSCELSKKYAFLGTVVITTLWTNSGRTSNVGSRK